MDKILLVDGNLLLFRSFYAAQVIEKTPGNLTAHLFFNSVLEILKEEKPNYVFFAFDAQGETKRHKEFSEYKANRTKAPIELYQQKDIIQQILSILKLKWFSKIGDEADDLIATLAQKYKNNYDIIIFSEDKDLLQLVDKNVCVLQKNRNKEIKERYIKVNNDNFINLYQFNPKQIVDFKGIAGDTSDNLSGIKGIGPKTAIELLKKYGTLENIYLNLSELKPKQKENFDKYKKHAFLCKHLATLNKNVELDFELNDLKYLPENFINSDVDNILEKYHLKKIWEIMKKM